LGNRVVYVLLWRTDMSIPSSRHFPRRTLWALGIVALIVVAAAVTTRYWLPEAKRLAVSWGVSKPTAENHKAHADDDHDEHAAKTRDSHGHKGEESDAHQGEKDHDAHEGEKGHDAHEGEEEGEESGHEGHQHDEAASVKLSPAAQANVGVQVATVALKPFERTINVPATVVEQPGRSHVQIAAPLTGVVTRIYPRQGEAVAPGQPLFDVRLTHEEVVEAQGAFLQTAEELDVVGREIERLEQVTAEGAVAGKTLLERKYEQQKLNATLRSQRQRLLLHGLSAAQVDNILSSRTLLSEMTIFVPAAEKGTGPIGQNGPRGASQKLDPPPSLLTAGGTPALQRAILQVEQLKVDQGQHVSAGQLLCILADFSELCIQGKAFEQDMPALERAATRDWPVSALVPSDDRRRQTVPNLKILSLANTVDAESRAFLFFVQLPNKLIRDRTTTDGRRFCAWQFKPGQRIELQVPVETWKQSVVLPRDAVIQDGAESYVFEKIDNHFDRRAVRVVYSDQYSAVLAPDDVLKAGKIIVVAGAYQIHLALKNKSGGAPDPHAGHNH
jgi:membrane fusion protein, heavy metal efflux system